MDKLINLVQKIHLRKAIQFLFKSTVFFSAVYTFNIQSSQIVGLQPLGYNCIKNISHLELKCTRCQFKSLSKIQMLNHFETSHKHKDVQREQQPMNLTNQRPIKSYSCPICSKSYVNQVVLEKHLRTHGGNQFRCSLCQFKTLDASNLRYLCIILAATPIEASRDT